MESKTRLATKRGQQSDGWGTASTERNEEKRSKERRGKERQVVCRMQSGERDGASEGDEVNDQIRAQLVRIPHRAAIILQSFLSRRNDVRYS